MPKSRSALAALVRGVMCSDMKYTELEQSILNWIALKEDDEVLSMQIENSVPILRKYTNIGLWLTIEVQNNIEMVSDAEDGDVDPILGPSIKIASSEYAESAIYVTNGYLDTLEIFNVSGEMLKENQDFILVSK